MSPYSRYARYVPAAALVVVASVAGWLATTSLQQDFAAYWVAGAARRAGLSPYVNHVGSPVAPDLWDGVAVFAHSRFLYPPLVADLFRGFALLPYGVAKAAFTALAVAAWAVAAALAPRSAGARGAAPLTFGVSALAYPLYLNLERGQMDLFVLVLLLMAFGARARPWRAGAALAVATTFKPALVGLVLVVAALGRWRVALAALVGVALLLLAGLATSGPALLRDYVVDVLPRAALYGEGGDEAMLLPDARLGARAAELEAGVARLGGRVTRQAAWELPASASLPRLLAPERPTPFASRAPALALLAALLASAATVRRRRTSEASEALLFWAAVVACVVASPAGWIMGLVWALPLVPWLARLRGAKGPTTPATWALGLACVACAAPPFVAGWGALAGTAVVASAIWLALTSSSRAGVAG